MDDSIYGIHLHWIHSPGIGGRIKDRPEDFVVDEIPLEFPDGKRYTAFRVEKRNMTTLDAVKRISRALGIDSRSIGYAGLKDRYAVTRQWMTARVSPGRVEGMKLEGIQVLETTRTGMDLRRGDLRGNRFEITVRDADAPENMNALSEEVDARGVPNFYGPQRFGDNRPITHLVGKAIVTGDYEEAVDTYLVRSFGNESDDVEEARRRLSENPDYAAALDYYPHRLGYERLLLKSLADGAGPIRALRSLPKSLMQLFVSAYQAWLFNTALSRFLADKEAVENFPAPIVGHETRLGDGEFDSIMRAVMEDEGIEEANFKCERLPEVSARGTFRAAMMSPELSYSLENDTVLLRFTLKKGSYATVVTREVMKS